MMIFAKEYELRGSDFDSGGHLRPASVLDLFQDVAGLHAERLGIGFETLLQRQEIWVLTKVRYRLVQAPALYERVRVRTWPLVPGRLSFRREYAIESLDGRVLVQGASEWVVVHATERRVLSPGNVYPAGEEHCTDSFFPPRLPKVPPLAATGEGLEIVPGYSHLDRNGHVNNTRYADYVVDALGSTAAVKELWLDYHKELLQGDSVTVELQRQEGCAVVWGFNGAGERMFACRVEVEE